MTERWAPWFNEDECKFASKRFAEAWQVITGAEDQAHDLDKIELAGRFLTQGIDDIADFLSGIPDDMQETILEKIDKIYTGLYHMKPYKNSKE